MSKQHYPSQIHSTQYIQSIKLLHPNEALSFHNSAPLDLHVHVYICFIFRFFHLFPRYFVPMSYSIHLLHENRPLCSPLVEYGDTCKNIFPFHLTKKSKTNVLQNIC